HGFPNNEPIESDAGFRLTLIGIPSKAFSPHLPSLKNPFVNTFSEVSFIFVDREYVLHYR
ncbi:MAG: hypothetical protein ACUVQ9_13230, partial [Thermodesulfobacteriota bacterium]